MIFKSISSYGPFNLICMWFLTLCEYINLAKQWILLILYFIQQGFPVSSNGKESACNAEDLGSIPESGRSPGEGNGNPLQYSCLENSMDRPWSLRVGSDWVTNMFTFILFINKTFKNIKFLQNFRLDLELFWEIKISQLIKVMCKYNSFLPLSRLLGSLEETI